MPIDVNAHEQRGVALSVLGDVALFDDSGREVGLSPQRMHLLAVLAAAAGSVVPRSGLIEDLWGAGTEDSETTRARLKTQVAQTRSALPRDLAIEYRLAGYRLCGALDRLDSTLFESLATGARQLDTAAAAQQYARALALWRGGEAFAGVDSLRVDETRHALDALRASVVIALADCEIALHYPQYSLSPIAAMFDVDTTRGDVAVRAAHLLALAGRQADALRVVTRHRDALLAAGLMPSGEVTELEGRILRHELVGEPVTVAASRAVVDARPSGDLLQRRALEQQVVGALAARPVALSGEAGVGKSTLVRAVITRFEAAGRMVVEVGASAEPIRPMEVIAEIYERFAADRADLVDALPDSPAAAAAVARLLGERRSDVPAISREQLIAELSSLVARLLVASGSVLVVEDVHWIDNGSAEVIAELANGASCTVLVTARQAVEELFGAGWRRFVQLDVPPFTMGEVRELLHQALPVRASDPLAESLYDGTGGNGLFLRLQLELLAEGNLGSDLPPTLTHTVYERTAGFSRATRDVLNTAALLGRSFPLAPLELVHPACRAILHDAVAERLVRIDDETETGEFVHGVVVDALVDNIRPAVRAERHDQLCVALGKVGASPIALAKQAVGAESLDPLRAVTSCRDAALAEAQVFEWERAVEWARSGLRIVDDVGLDDPAVEAQLRSLVGTGLRRLDQPGGTDDLGRAADLAYSLGDHELLVRCVTELCLHGPTTQAGAVDETARLHLHRALASPVDDCQRAELMSAAATLMAISDQANVGRSLYLQALTLADASGDASVIRTVRMNAHLGLAHPDDVSLRRRVSDELLAIGDPEARWEGHFVRFGLALIDADRDAIDTAVGQLRSLTPLVKQRNRDRGLSQIESVVAFLDGDFELAEQIADATLHASLGSQQVSWAMSSYAALLLPIREAQRRVGELLDAVEALTASSPDFATWHVMTALVACARDDTTAMAREIEYLAERDFRFVEDVTWTAVATELARPIRALGDRDAAALLRERLMPHAGTMTWNGLSTHGPVDAGLACLADVLGDADGVDRHLLASRLLVDRLGSRHLWWPELDGIAEQRDANGVPRV